jgi:chromosome segregation ATPase
MKIIKLQAENVKKLKAVEITPDDNVVIISGRNEQGKTSVLDSIWYALGGAEAMKGTVKPIREGETAAKVTLTLDDLIVTRTFTEKGSYLRVENQDGAQYKSPQAILDRLIGKLSFDPLAFSNMDDKKRREVLLGLVKIDLDLEAWARERKGVYDERTLVNRQGEETKALLGTLPEIPADTPDEEISSASILHDQAAAQKIIRENDAKRAALRKKSDEYLEVQEVIEETKRRLAELEAKREQLLAEGQAMKAEVEALDDPDLNAYADKLVQVEGINKAVRAKHRKQELADSLGEYRAKSNHLTAQLVNLDQQKVEAIKAAKFPIEGLAFDEDGVTYRGIPFSQCSSAERLRVSLAMAMALNPKIKVLRITDGSLLDKDNLQVIREMVEAQDYQLWLERVATDGRVGIVIEDGMVLE